MRFPGLDRLCRNINDTCLHLRPLRQNLPREFLVFFVHSLGNITKICYNIFNAPVSVTDANGIVTKYAYNDPGLVTRMDRLDGSETLTSLSVAYDGSVVGIWNPLGGAVIAITAAGFRDVIRALDGNTVTMVVRDGWTFKGRQCIDRRIEVKLVE